MDVDWMYPASNSNARRLCGMKRHGKKKTTNNDNKHTAMLAEVEDDEERVSRIGSNIYFYAGVSKDSIAALNAHIVAMNEEFRKLQAANPSIEMVPGPIMLHINTYGGSLFAGFWAVDIIKQSKIPVDTVVEGATASCGTLMSVVGRKRYIRPTASMLIHQLNSWFGGKMTEIDDDYQNLEQMTKTIKRIYKEHTKLTDAQLVQVLEHDVWWMSEKCIETGLVDEVWKG